MKNLQVVLDPRHIIMGSLSWEKAQELFSTMTNISPTTRPFKGPYEEMRRILPSHSENPHAIEVEYTRFRVVICEKKIRWYWYQLRKTRYIEVVVLERVDDGFEKVFNIQIAKPYQLAEELDLKDLKWLEYYITLRNLLKTVSRLQLNSP